MFVHGRYKILGLKSPQCGLVERLRERFKTHRNRMRQRQNNSCPLHWSPVVAADRVGSPHVCNAALATDLRTLSLGVAKMYLSVASAD
jgi:hypothetical protein